MKKGYHPAFCEVIERPIAEHLPYEDRRRKGRNKEKKEVPTPNFLSLKVSNKSSGVANFP